MDGLPPFSQNSVVHCTPQGSSSAANARHAMVKYTCSDSVRAIIRKCSREGQTRSTGTDIHQVPAGLLPHPLQLGHRVVQARDVWLQAALGPHRGHLHSSRLHCILSLRLVLNQCCDVWCVLCLVGCLNKVCYICEVGRELLQEGKVCTLPGLVC